MAASTTSPVCVVCVGMAGSGKTTFMQRINSYLYEKKDPPYVVNLDPAVHTVPFDSNIDIRDSVNYKEVMRQYNLGPNGGILTSLNLFATKIDQILGLLEKRAFPNGPPLQPDGGDATSSGKGKQQAKKPGSATKSSGKDDSASSRPALKHILVDTPGQIEVFVWSASGDILLSSLASTFPTVVAYIVDTPRSCNTSTFMANMLYAISILYKTKLPMIVVFNKADAQDPSFAKEWMTDFTAFQEALNREQEGVSFAGIEGGESGPVYGGGSGYMGSLLNSMSLVLEEFYKHLHVVGVSAMTGQGVDEFFAAVEAKKDEFERDYKPELLLRQAERQKEKEKNKDGELASKIGGMQVSGQPRRRPPKKEPETVSEAEEEDSDEEMDDEESEEYEKSEPEHDKDDGIQARYQKALQGQSAAESNSKFSQYLQRANLG